MHIIKDLKLIIAFTQLNDAEWINKKIFWWTDVCQKLQVVVSKAVTAAMKQWKCFGTSDDIYLAQKYNNSLD